MQSTHLGCATGSPRISCTGQLLDAERADEPISIPTPTDRNRKDRERYDHVIAEAKRKKAPYEIEFRHQSNLGGYRHMRESGEPVLDAAGNLIRTVGIVQDISKSKRTEEILRKSQDDLAEAQRMAKIGHWYWSIETDSLVSCSGEYARIHGVSMDEIKDHLSRQMEIVVHPADRDRVRDAFKHADIGGCDYEIGYRIVRPDGEVRYVHEIGEAVLDEDGRPIAHSGTVQDVTEHKRVEEALSVLDLVPKKAAGIIAKTLRSAVANAQDTQNVDVDRLYVKMAFVDEAPVWSRWRARAQGRATQIAKRSSHITLVLDERGSGTQA